MPLTQISSRAIEDTLRYVLGASGTNHYTFTGKGLTGAVNDPTLTLSRGHTYIFENRSGGHPFYIKTSIANGGTNDAYNTGVTNNGGGNGTEIIFTVPHDAPDTLYYQCSSHSTMAGQLSISGSVADGSITESKLADDAVTADKLANSINTAIAANTAKDLTALSASNLTSGTVPDARISASSVTQHATSFDDNNIINDISALALKLNALQNATRYNTNSTSVETFQDANGIASFTTTSRNTGGEYVATSSESTIVSNGTLIETGKDNDKFETSLSNNGYVAQGILIKPATKIIFKSVFFYGYGTTGSSNEKLYISANYGSNNLTTPPSNANNFHQYSYSNSSGLVGGTLNNNITIDNLTGGSNLQAWLVVETTGFGGGMIAGKGTGNSTSGAYYNALSTNYVGAYIDSYINSGASMSVSADEIMAMKLVGDVIQLATNATGNFISNVITASASTSKMGVVITYIDHAGTATLNTDLKVSVSADNGSNFTQVTLVAQPDFATGVKMAIANDVTVTAGTQLKYKVEFANQASGSKQTRVTGVSLQF